MVVAYINGKRVVFSLDDVHDDYTYLTMVRTQDGEEFYLAEDSQEAGEKARRVWEDLIEDDPEEFACLVGEETLIRWAVGQYAGSGTAQVQSLTEWLDLWLDIPEKEWAKDDGVEREFQCKHPDFKQYTVAYKCR